MHRRHRFPPANLVALSFTASAALLFSVSVGATPDLTEVTSPSDTAQPRLDRVQAKDKGGDKKGGDKKGGDKKGGDKSPDRNPTKDDYKIDTSGSSTDIKLNRDGTLSIRIQPAAGLKVHPQAPLEAKIKTSSGLKPKKKKLGHSDVTDKDSIAPELTCALHAERAGDHDVEVDLSFFLCSESVCQRMKEKIRISVKVAP